MNQKLAINGGTPAIPTNLTFHNWPPIDEQDEQLILEAIR